MNTGKITLSISIAANIGVLIGIVFLAIEIEQANVIAGREARNQVAIRLGDVHQTILENPEIAAVMSKLRATDATLSDVESVQAASIASLLGGRIADVNLNLETDFLSEDISMRGIAVILTIPRQYPGLTPYMVRMFEIGPSPAYGISAIYDVVYQSLNLEGFRGANPI